MHNLTIYRSSAGSGKTYTLVKEYLLIALQYPMQFRHILAITFTNKATAEMKGRIIKTLGELANGTVSSLSEELELQINLTNCTLQERATEVLSNILHQYSSFSISTIDSFFNEIVKSLAHELKLSLRFEIELDQGYIISQACEQLLNLVGSDETLRRNLEKFIEYKMEYDKGWKIKDELSKIGQRLFDEEAASSLIDFDNNEYNEIIKKLRVIRSGYEKTMTAFGNKFVQSLKSNGYSIEDFSYKESGVAGYLMKIVTPLSSDKYKPGKRVLDTSLDEEKWLSKDKRNNPVLVSYVNSFCHPLLLEVISFYNANYLIYNSAVEALPLIYVRGILSKLNEEIKHYRDEYNVITLSDANKLIRSSVQSSDTPLIFEKTGNFYSHYLLDEFQDTSSIQWENIRPLISEVLANNKSALIVGDVKQSIYRWRGGNMELLHNGVEKDLSAFEELINVQQLSVNYRSTKQIIEFNNAFFAAAPAILDHYNKSPLPLINEAYGAGQLHQQLPEKFKNNGFVQINLLANKAEDDDDHWQDRSLNLMLKQINDLLASGYQYGDIAILVRKNDEGNRVANFLYKNGIHQIRSNDSLLLSKAPQVIFIINCLRYLMSPEDILLTKEIEWYLRDDSELIKESLHTFFDSKSTNNAQIPLLASFRKLRGSISMLPVDETVTHIISHFRLNQFADAFIQRFQDVTIEYLQKYPSDVSSFIKWWDETNERANFSVIMPVESDAIQITTIHKAKGLQFQIVMMPFADWKLKPKAGSLLWANAFDSDPFNLMDEWPLNTSEKLLETIFSESYIKVAEENYIDNLNLLYVAFTRACQQLYITVLNKEKSTEKTLSDFIIDILKSHPQIDTNASIITFGDLEPKSAEIAANKKSGLFSPETVLLNSYPIHKWQHLLSLKTENTFTSKEIETGLMVHKTLSFIHNEKELEQAIYKAKNLFHLDDKNVKVLEMAINQIFDLCRGEQWFNEYYQVMNETEFIAPDGTIQRPDRVMIKGNNAIIIDYKTGEEKDSHHRQTLKYKELLTDCGYSDVRCWLIYTSSNKLVPVN